MTMWSHQHTIFRRRYTLPYVGLVSLCVAIITALFLTVASVHAASNHTLAFQGRLLLSNGSAVPDGHYNVEFKIYQGGTGTAAGNPGGTLEWTEDYTNNNANAGVTVKNSYFSVNLGSNTPLSDSIDWSNPNLWLSLNVGGSAADCTSFGAGTCVGDGEMVPMTQITASPYALDSGKLNGKTSDDFIQNTTAPQNASFNISGSGTAASIATGSLDTTSADGTLSIGTVNAQQINIGQNTDGTWTQANIAAGAGGINYYSGGDMINRLAGTFSVSTLSNTQILTIDTQTKDVHIDYFSTFTSDGKATVNNTLGVNTTNANAFSVQDANGNSALSVDTATSTVTMGNLVTSSIDTSSATPLSIGASNSIGVAIGNTTTNGTNTLYGNTIVKGTTGNDTTTAFQLQRADGTSMFTADSLNQTITIGNAVSGDKMTISTATGQVTYFGSARHTKKISLAAEYANSILDAGTGSSNTGTMTSDIDLTNRMNYYKWTTNQSSTQSYDVVVQIPLPTDFDGWASSNPLSVTDYTSDTTNGTVALEARDSTGTPVCNISSTFITPATTNTWSTNNSACTLSSGTYTAGNYITLRLRMSSPQGGDVRLGNINLSYLSKY